MFTRNSARWRVPLIAPVLALATLISLGAGGQAGAKAQTDGSTLPTVVLVHGDWADGSSSWAGVIERLQERGFTAVAPPNLLRGPAADGPYLARYLHSISGPCSSPTPTAGSSPRTPPRATRTSRHSSTSMPSCRTKARSVGPS